MTVCVGMSSRYVEAHQFILPHCMFQRFALPHTSVPTSVIASSSQSIVGSLDYCLRHSESNSFSISTRRNRSTQGVSLLSSGPSGHRVFISSIRTVALCPLGLHRWRRYGENRQSRKMANIRISDSVLKNCRSSKASLSHCQHRKSGVSSPHVTILPG